MAGQGFQDGFSPEFGGGSKGDREIDREEVAGREKGEHGGALRSFRKYRRDGDVTYSLGAYPTMELLLHRPEQARCVLVHSAASAEVAERVSRLCASRGVSLLRGCDRALERIREKESCLVAGVLNKEAPPLSKGTDHVILVEPGDAGNLGTILRACLGFGVRDLAVVGQGADIFHPRVIRASMGAFFSMRIERFADFDAYRRFHGKDREFYCFMPGGELRLGRFPAPAGTPFGLVFGNEARGLPESFRRVGKSVAIPQSPDVDSLNLALAAGIGIYEFTKGRDFTEAAGDGGLPGNLRGE